jgi:hypothetical protein
MDFDNGYLLCSKFTIVGLAPGPTFQVLYDETSTYVRKISKNKNDSTKKDDGFDKKILI